jgi:UDP-N-acetylmuramate--alanine ligase
MSGIARLLLSEGCIVSGCDVGSSDITRELPQAGISVALGHSPRHLDDNTELVVMSAAVRETNPEVRAAHQRGIQVLKYAQALGCLLADRDGVAVAGSHGKTTTSSMIAYSMNVAGRDPGMVIGGLVPQLGGSACAGGAGPFVVEACEYDRSFLNLRPKTAVITNIDSDHLDYYSGIDELIDAFGRFVSHVGSDGLVVVNGDDPNAMRAATYTPARVETFGATRGCTWRVGEWSRENGMTRFHVYRNNRTWGRFELIVPGLYNVLNATACLAVCTYFGIRKPDLRKALAAFSGVRRRFDRIGEVAGVMVLDDYGHHPTEVRVTLKAVRKDFPSRRLVCVFQPHQCSRTRIFLKEFAKSLTTADCVIVPDIYSVRDTAADQRSVHARDLVAQLRENGVQAEYQAELENVLDQLLADVRQGDLVMTMGAGPVDGVGRRLLAELRKRETSNELVLRS